MVKIYTKLFIAVLALSSTFAFAQAGNVGINTAKSRFHYGY